MRPDPARGNLVESVGRPVEGDVHRRLKVALAPLAAETHVDDDLARSADERLEVGETDDRVGPRGNPRPWILAVLTVADAPRDDLLDADASQRTPGGSNVVHRPSDQAQRASPREQPAEVCGQRVGELERQRAGEMPSRERVALAQVDHPLPGCSALGKLPGAARLR